MDRARSARRRFVPVLLGAMAAAVMAPVAAQDADMRYHHGNIWHDLQRAAGARATDPDGTGYPADRMRNAADDVGGTSMQAVYDGSALVNGTYR